MSPVALTLLLLLQLGFTAGAVRTQVSDVLEAFGEPSDEDATCIDSLRSLVNATTYRDLFRPVLDGTYMIRDKTSGDNVGVSPSGEVHLTSGTDLTYWKLERLPRGVRATDMPSFTLKSSRKGSLLVANERTVTHVKARSAGMESHWRLVLDDNGKYFAVQSVQSGLFLQKKGDDDLEVGDNPDERSWELVPTRKRGSKNFKRELAKQWPVVSNMPLIPSINSRLTWREVSPAKMAVGQYAGERKRYQFFGKIVETRRHVVTENKVTNICDMAIPSMRGFTSSANVVRDLYFSNVAHQCPTNNIANFQRNLRQALEEECFGSCRSTMAELLPSRIQCGHPEKANLTEIFETAIAKDWQCSNLMPDNLEFILENQAQQLCWKFHAPQLLWTYNDHAAHEIASTDWWASCAVYHPVRMTSKSPKDIMQHHACPEGTACDCPKTYLQKAESTDTIRRKGKQTVFVPPGSALVPAIINAYKKKFVLSASVNAVWKALMFGSLGGLSSAALVGMATSPVFLFFTVFSAFMGAKGKWRCTNTVGCWPLTPHAVRIDSSTVCRMPEEAKEGRSPVSFLPPPGLKAELDAESKFVKCHLTACSDGERRAQVVGFGGGPDAAPGSKTNIYNCQPLTFMDMSHDQKSMLVEALRASGISSEYTINWNVTQSF